MRLPLRICLSGIVSFALVLSAALSQAFAGPVTLTSQLGKPLMLSGEKQLNYLKIGLTGESNRDEKSRAPVNLAIVIDRSGSMQGAKLDHAKRAANLAITRLNRDDIISVVAYDDQVDVLVPATKVSDREMISRAIDALTPGNSTALFAGVSKGAAEVRKFHDQKRVNRIILLSDGLANVGPSAPEELGELGASLRREGISVTTLGLGLGYNEDLMAQLARRSDGNHAFVETPEQLSRIFDAEFGDVLSVCAQDVKVTIRFENARPVRVLGRDADIHGQTVVAGLNQLYGGQEKFVLVELDVPAGEDRETRTIANVTVTFAGMKTGAVDTLQSSVSVKFSSNRHEVEESERKDVMISAVNLLANENYKLATRLRDEGKVEDARKALAGNVMYLRDNATRYKSPQLKSFAEKNEESSKNLDEKNWNRNRKDMRKMQHSNDYQQSY